MPLDHPIEFILLLKSMIHISVQRLIRSTQKSTIFSVASARKVWLIQVQVNCLDNHLSWPEGVQYSLIYLHSHIHQLAKNLWTWLFPASTSPLSSETLYDGGIPSRFNPREVCAASESMKRVRSVNPCKYAIICLPSSDDAHCKWLLLAVWFKKLRRVIN